MKSFMNLREHRHSYKKFDPLTLKLSKSFLRVTFNYNKCYRSHRKTSIRALRDPLRSTNECCVGDAKKKCRC